MKSKTSQPLLQYRIYREFAFGSKLFEYIQITPRIRAGLETSVLCHCQQFGE